MDTDFDTETDLDSVINKYMRGFGYWIVMDLGTSGGDYSFNPYGGGNENKQDGEIIYDEKEYVTINGLEFVKITGRCLCEPIDEENTEPIYVNVIIYATLQKNSENGKGIITGLICLNSDYYQSSLKSGSDSTLDELNEYCTPIINTFEAKK